MAKQKPETEVLLEDLQTKFLETRDPQIWKEMFEIMIKYARSLTLKINKGKVYLEPEHVLGVATDAAIKIMERYSDPDFKITHSFAGLLKWKVIESLYGGWEEEAHLSLNYVFQEDSSAKTELGDLQSKINVTSLTPELVTELKENDVENFTFTLNNILKEYDEACDSYRASLLGRTYLLLWLRKSKIRHAPTLFKKYVSLSPKEEEVLDLLLLEIRNRLSLLN